MFHSSFPALPVRRGGVIESTVAAVPSGFFLSLPPFPSELRLPLTAAELDRAFTVSGVLDTVARDQVIATDAIVVRPGQPAAVNCWLRPLGGTP